MRIISSLDLKLRLPARDDLPVFFENKYSFHVNAEYLQIPSTNLDLVGLKSTKWSLLWNTPFFINNIFLTLAPKIV